VGPYGGAVRWGRTVGPYGGAVRWGRTWGRTKRDISHCFSLTFLSILFELALSMKPP